MSFAADLSVRRINLKNMFLSGSGFNKPEGYYNSCYVQPCGNNNTFVRSEVFFWTSISFMSVLSGQKPDKLDKGGQIFEKLHGVLDK